MTCGVGGGSDAFVSPPGAPSVDSVSTSVHVVGEPGSPLIPEPSASKPERPLPVESRTRPFIDVNLVESGPNSVLKAYI